MAKVLLKLAAAALVYSACAPASAQDFYKGRTITIVVGASTGGGFDANARLLSRHWARHIPGRPDIVVSNMIGAASMVAVNYLDAGAAKDGTVVTTFNYGQVTTSRIQPDKVKTDFRNFSWLGSIAEDPEFCYVPKALGVAGLDALKARGRINMGVTNFGTANDISQRIMRGVLGVDVRQIAGYPGNTEIKLALERGEVDATCSPWSELPPDWQARGDIVPFLNFGSYRPPSMPANVPFALDLAGTARNRSIINVLMASAIIGRPFIMSKVTPEDRMTILRKAFDDTMKDPAFMADAAKLNMPIAPKSGAEARSIVESIYTTPDDVVQAARRIMEEEGPK